MNKRTINCLYRYNTLIKKLINEEKTVKEIAYKLNIDITRVYTDIKRFGTKEDLVQIRNNELSSIERKNKINQAKQNCKTANYKRAMQNKKRFENIVRPLIWSGMSTIDIKNQLKLKATSAISRSVKKYGNALDNEQLKHNGIVKKRNALLKLMSDKTSKPEHMLFNITKEYFPSAQHKFKILSDKQYYWELDVAIPEIMLNLEYDGYYWHRNNTVRDNHRDNILKERGWNIIRFKYSETPSLENLENEFKHRVLSLLK